jgi:pimeloyl-ACP methyl ester carboxylesterase
MLSRGLCKVEGGVMWRSDSRLRWPSRLRLSEEQALAFVRAIECPTMLVRAVDDLQFMSEVASQERIRLVRDLELVNLDGSHHVHIDHARDVAHRVGPFLAHAVASAPK